MLVDLAVLTLGAARLAGEQSQNPIRIADRGYFGIGDDDGIVGEIHGQMCALLDARRRIAKDVIEVLGHLFEDATDAVLSEGILVPRL